MGAGDDIDQFKLPKLAPLRFHLSELCPLAPIALHAITGYRSGSAPRTVLPAFDKLFFYRRQKFGAQHGHH
jgi:hypothetical protein